MPRANAYYVTTLVTIGYGILWIKINLAAYDYVSFSIQY